MFASYAALGDVNLAEPNALIGFAGARVGRRHDRPGAAAGFQRAEFLFEHGFVDRVVAARRRCARELARLLRFLRPLPVREAATSRMVRRALAAAAARRRRPRHASAVGATRRRAAVADAKAGASWARVQLARNLAPAAHPRAARARWPTRSSSSTATGGSATTPRWSPASPGSTAAGSSFVGQQKGADTEENIRRNFGMPHPEGYRKAMRVMELAERFGLPIVTFVDVPGAHPGPESEERGIAEAIARSIGLMTRLRTPIVTVITGEGGSGGALAIAVGDVVLALENAVYSVISPRGLREHPVADRGRGADRRRSRCG